MGFIEAGDNVMENSYLKKNESTKDKQIKKYKRRAKALLIVLIIVVAILAIQIIQDMFTSFQEAIAKNYSNVSINETSTTCENPTFVDNIIAFMDRLFIYPVSFWTKFFIFLGIIYIIQIAFSLIFDVVELILLLFVAIKRLCVWIYRKITGKNERDEQLKKISEMYDDAKFK